MCPMCSAMRRGQCVGRWRLLARVSRAFETQEASQAFALKQLLLDQPSLKKHLPRYRFRRKVKTWLQCNCVIETPTLSFSSRWSMLFSLKCHGSVVSDLEPETNVSKSGFCNEASHQPTAIAPWRKLSESSVIKVVIVKLEHLSKDQSQSDLCDLRFSINDQSVSNHRWCCSAAY